LNNGIKINFSWCCANSTDVQVLCKHKKFRKHWSIVGFEVLTAVSTKMAVSIITLMMEAARTSETLVNFCQTTQLYNPEDSHLSTVLLH
jgi:hypothetical protein